MDNSIQFAIIAFCLVVMALQLLINGGFGGGESFSWLKVVLEIVLASAAAAGTFVALGGAKKR